MFKINKPEKLNKLWKLFKYICVSTVRLDDNMKTLALFLGLTTVLFSFSKLYAQKVNADTLIYTVEDCIQYALENHLDIKNTKIDEKVNQQKVYQVRATGLPQINGEAQYQYFAEIPTTLIPNFFGGRPNEYIPVQFGVPHNWSAGVTASQLIFSGSYIVGLQAAKTVAELSRKNTKRQEAEVRAAVQKAFYTALLTQENIKLIEVNLIRLDSTLRTLIELQKAGYADKIAVDRIQVAKNNLEIERKKLQNAAALTLNLLKFQMGMEINTPLKIKGTLNLENTPSIPLSEKPDYTQRPEYQLLQTQIKLSQLSLKAVRAEYLPTLASFVSASTSGPNQKFYFFNYDQRWFPAVIIGARINIPIFDGFGKYARANQAKLEKQKAENSLLRFTQAAELEVANARTNYLNALNTLEIQKKNVELAQEVYNTTQLKNASGKASYLEITDAENALKTAQINYYNAQYDAIMAKIDYLKAVGKLN